MKILKILGGIIVALVLVAAGAYFVLLHPPSAEATCEHFIALAKKATEGSNGTKVADAAFSSMDKCLEKEKVVSEGKGFSPPEPLRVTKVRRECVLKATDYNQAVKYSNDKKCD